MDNSMQFQQPCVDLVKQEESFESKPYPDPASGGEPITIGYGTTHYCDGKKVTMYDNPIWPKDAERVLLCHLNNTVLPCIKSHVTSDINQNQLDALGDFIYNVGTGNFATSTLLKKINANPADTTITDEFLKWNKAKGKVLDDLTNRRRREAALYFS